MLPPRSEQSIIKSSVALVISIPKSCLMLTQSINLSSSLSWFVVPLTKTNLLPRASWVMVHLPEPVEKIWSSQSAWVFATFSFELSHEMILSVGSPKESREIKVNAVS